MKTNVSTLLREFPKIRRAALSGETVIIETREGNLRLTADHPSGNKILGRMKGKIQFKGDLSKPTTHPSEWKASL